MESSLSTLTKAQEAGAVLSENVVKDDDAASLLVKKKDHMGACLLLFDDNHYLVEWLAYHYHSLPLRELIVVTDPRSQTSPADILRRWEGRIHYEIWNETRVFPDGKLDYYRSKNDLVQLHRARQGYFYIECLKEFRKRGSQQWVAFVDVDEYVVVNPTAATKHTSFRHRHYHQPAFNFTAEPGNVLSFLKYQQENKDPGFSPCYHMARRDFVAQESSPQEIARNVPTGINGTNLFTTRWRYRGDRRITGKCLVQSWIHAKFPSMAPKQGHVVLPRVCPPGWYAKYAYKMDTSPLTVHHYLGSAEQYLYRDDPRRDRTADYFQFKGQGKLTVDDSARAWLPAFVQDVGLDEAIRLLEGAGQVAVKRKS